MAEGNEPAKKTLNMNAVAAAADDDDEKCRAD